MMLMRILEVVIVVVWEEVARVPVVIDQLGGDDGGSGGVECRPVRMMMVSNMRDRVRADSIAARMCMVVVWRFEYVEHEGLLDLFVARRGWRVSVVAKPSGGRNRVTTRGAGANMGLAGRGRRGGRRV